jgi:hypothetical protein
MGIKENNKKKQEFFLNTSKILNDWHINIYGKDYRSELILEYLNNS